MELFIYRHGEIETGGRYIGQTDVPLSQKGLEQNQQSLKALKQIPVDQIYISDLKRCFVNNAIIEKCLREINFGQWEGMTWNQIELKFEKESKKYLSDPLNFTFPNGESYQQVKLRIDKFIENIKLTKVERIGLVTHGGVVRSIVSTNTNIPFWDVKIEYGGFIQLSI